MPARNHPTDRTGADELFSTAQPANYYELLQVSLKADPEIIEVAFKKLAMKYHPDHNPGNPNANAVMQALNSAYAILSDPAKRADYDASLLEQPDFANFTRYEATAATTPTDYYNFDDKYYYPPRQPIKGRTVLKAAGMVLVALLLWLLLSRLFEPDMTATSATSNTTEPAATSVALAEPIPATVQKLTPLASSSAVGDLAGNNALFSEDFEAGQPGRWRLESPWHRTTRQSAGGQYSLWFGDEGLGRYRNGINARATLIDQLNLTGAERAVLRFNLIGQSASSYNSSTDDRLIVEISTNGNEYTPIFSTTELYANWQPVTLDLSRWKDRVIKLQVRFISSTTSNTIGFTGYFLDDLRVERL